MYASDLETESRLPPDYPPLPVLRLTVAEYERIVACGIFGDKAPFELLEGYLVPKVRKSPQHCYYMEALRRILETFLPSGVHCRSGGPITLSTSEPEPDLAIVRGEVLDYYERHPTGEETLLVVEFIDSSLSRDSTFKNRNWKRRIYDEDRIPCYWIVDTAAKTIEKNLTTFPDNCFPNFETFGRNDVIRVAFGPENRELPLDKLFRISDDE